MTRSIIPCGSKPSILWSSTIEGEELRVQKALESLQTRMSIERKEHRAFAAGTSWIHATDAPPPNLNATVFEVELSSYQHKPCVLGPALSPYASPHSATTSGESYPAAALAQSAAAVHNKAHTSSCKKTHTYSHMID